MMEDRPKSVLSEYYQESISRIKEYLEIKYCATPVTEDDDDFPPIPNTDRFIFFKLKVHDSELPKTLILAIPFHFPDSLPRIYLSKEDYSKLAPIPHVDKNRFVCTRDPSIAHVNEKRQEEAVDELLKIALDIIKKGAKKENYDEFGEEFLAYWNEQAEIKYLSLWTPSSVIERLKIINIASKLPSFKYIISRDIEEVKNWAAPLKIQIDENNAYDAIHLPLFEPINVPLPQNNHDVYEIIKKGDKDGCAALEKYINKDKSHRVILASFQVDNERIFIGWMFDSWNKEIYKGFRSEKLPLGIRMQRTSSVPIQKICIERADPERIFNRGGLGIKKSLIGGSVAIIGCGSLGSHLANSLSESGISDFLLVDKEKLELANVARHICGFNESIRQCPKSDAVKDLLLAHFPHIKCQAIQEDILNLLEKEETLFDKYSTVIVAVGDEAIERRLNYLFLKGKISSPLIFIWMEPFGVAGQFLFIHPKGRSCFQCCFNSNGTFRFSVAKPDVSYLKREAGCQSTFMPYSNLEVDHFIHVVTRRILRCFDEKQENSFLMTWLGDLTRFRSMGYKINDEWIADFDYSTYERPIEKNKKCDACEK
jgi:molybdopterin/thiamine biosynthesis adenylyltransferase